MYLPIIDVFEPGGRRKTKNRKSQERNDTPVAYFITSYIAANMAELLAYGIAVVVQDDTLALAGHGVSTGLLSLPS